MHCDRAGTHLQGVLQGFEGVSPGPPQQRHTLLPVTPKACSEGLQGSAKEAAS